MSNFDVSTLGKLPTGIRTTPSGAYEAVLVSKLLPNGRIARTFKTLAQAVDWRSGAKAALGAGGARPEVVAQISTARGEIGGTLVRSVVQAYLDDRDASISKSMRMLLPTVARQVPEHLRVADVTIVWAEGWVAAMKGNKLTPSSIRKRVGALAQVLRWWHKKQAPGQVLPNPLKMLDRGYSVYGDNLPERVEDEVRDRRLRPGEHEKIQAALRSAEKIPDVPDAHKPHLLMLYQILVLTALRLREAYRIQLRDINLESRILQVKPGKTGKGRRVPLRRELLEQLQAYIAQHHAGAPADTPLLPFCPLEVLQLPDGDRRREQRLRDITNRLSRMLGDTFRHLQLPDLTAHDLRHEGICQWFMLRRPDGHWRYRPEELRLISGHKTAAMLERYLEALRQGDELAADLD